MDVRTGQTIVLGARVLSRGPDLLAWVKGKQDRHSGYDVQLMNADAVYGKDHLISAIEHAQRAFARGQNSATDLMVEIILYASAERQIKKAIEKVGLKENTERIAAILIGDVDEDKVTDLLASLHLERDDSVLDGSVEVLDLFGIGEKERLAISREKWGDLILERVAMLDLDK
jgi:KEOPS complex subunit Cgi121